VERALPWSMGRFFWSTPLRALCLRPVRSEKGAGSPPQDHRGDQQIDRQDARPDEVLNEIYDLLIDLNATDDQLEFPCSTRSQGRHRPEKPGRGRKNLHVLLDSILEEISGPSYDSEAPFQMLVSDLGYSDYVGRLAIGKIFNGTARSGANLVCISGSGQISPLKVSKLQVYDGITLREMDEVQPGDIVVLAGIEEVKIGDTISTGEAPEPCPESPWTNPRCP